MNEKPKVGQIYEIFGEEKTSGFIKIVKVIEKDDRIHYIRYTMNSSIFLMKYCVCSMGYFDDMVTEQYLVRNSLCALGGCLFDDLTDTMKEAFIEASFAMQGKTLKALEAED